jgi:hypothetical protein
MNATDIEIIELCKGGFAEIGVRYFGDTSTAEIDNSCHDRALL